MVQLSELCITVLSLQLRAVVLNAGGAATVHNPQKTACATVISTKTRLKSCVLCELLGQSGQRAAGLSCSVSAGRINYQSLAINFNYK